jgi:hypothetical protein
MTNKTATATATATTDDAIAPVLIEDDRTVYLYLGQTDAGPAPFTIRKARGKGAATRPFIFDPNGASVTRVTTDAATVRAYCAEPDADKRAALIADASIREQDSRITPDVSLVEAWSALVASVTPEGVEPLAHAAAMLASGILPVPGKVRAASDKARKDDTSDVLASLFA